MAESLEEKAGEALLVFTDFLYAVVFGLIVSETYAGIINATAPPLPVKGNRFLLVLGVFYFLIWDWLHGRLFTLKNPYKRYGRFFYEVLIAISGYGAALKAIQGRVSFLFYIATILGFGVIWAKITLREHKESPDKAELIVISRYQFRSFLVIGAAFVLLRYFLGAQTVAFWGNAVLIVFGWGFIFVYEASIPRSPGILGGPGVPFLTRIRVRKMRSWILEKLKGGKRQ